MGGVGGGDSSLSALWSSTLMTRGTEHISLAAQTTGGSEGWEGRKEGGREGGKGGVPEEVTGAEREIAFSVNCHPRETAEEGKQEKFHSCSPRCHLNLRRHLLTAPTHIDAHAQKSSPLLTPFCRLLNLRFGHLS